MNGTAVRIDIAASDWCRTYGKTHDEYFDATLRAKPFQDGTWFLQVRDGDRWTADEQTVRSVLRKLVEAHRAAELAKRRAKRQAKAGQVAA